MDNEVLHTILNKPYIFPVRLHNDDLSIANENFLVSLDQFNTAIFSSILIGVVGNALLSKMWASGFGGG